MSYNGSGTFQINTTGQPVVTGTVISSTAFNALTADLATGLSTAITKDGQTATTARIPFAAGISSTLVTDSSSTSTGSIITAGGVGIAKNLYVGVNANIAGTLSVTGSTTLTNPVINNIKMGYSTTATAAGTTTLTVSSNYRQFFTGSTTQTIVLPVTSTLVTGMAFEIENNSTGLLTVNSSGGNLVGTIPAGVCAHAVCIGTTLTTAADWDWDYISTTTITGTGANVLGTSPTITTPTISSLSSAAATALTLQSAGTTAITVDTSQNVGIGTASPASYGKLAVVAPANGTSLCLTDNTQSTLYIKHEATNVLTYQVGGTAEQRWVGNSLERMRIDTSGNLLVGITSSSAGKLVVSSNGSNDTLMLRQNGASGVTAQTAIAFQNATPSYVGSITCNGTVTSYNTTSDQRLKENIQDADSASALIESLQVRQYDWKESGLHQRYGFVAQELVALVPEAVYQPTYSEQMMAVDYSKLVPILVKAIQEQQALITALTARITALEAK